MTSHGSNGPDLRNYEYFIDRELSWLAFNDRVIEEAEDETTPLLERLKFLGIASNNLDEFFMVRLSGIQEQLAAEVRSKNPSGFTPSDQFELAHKVIHGMTDRLYRCYNEQILPAMGRQKIAIRRVRDLKGRQHDFVNDFFDREVFPVLTPLAVDSAHPFPHLKNLSLNLAVRLEPPRDFRAIRGLFAVVQVPAVLERIVRIPSDPGSYEFILLEDLISEEVQTLFPGLKVQEVSAFRVTRDADIEFAEEEADDLLKTIENELRGRERGSAVRLGVEAKCSEDLQVLLATKLGLQPLQVYRQDGPINLQEVAGIANRIDRQDLKYRPFVPSLRDPLRTAKNIFDVVARQDILLHHPFESFAPVEEFVAQAARDPNVLAIKQTLYRTSRESQIVRALMEAAENGKQVAALMELRARFDEARNIGWARQLERAGVHVVYGLVGLKTHAKICLVVRKEEDGIRRYVHLGTGNYNPITAKLYSDLGLLTCDPDLCDDASELFNLLTGYSRMPEWRKMIVAPISMRETIIKLIREEREKAKAGRPGRIRAKINSLVDPEIIEVLYEASRAGVQVDLLVRGICCLRPGIPGVSENIRVSSIVDRFLEHTRILVFGEGEDEKVFLTSADWMQRNLDRRIEIAFPIEEPALRERVVKEVLELGLRDNVKRRILQPDGTYIRATRESGDRPLRSQQWFLEIEAGLREVTRTMESSPEVLVGTAATGGPSAPKTPQRPAQPAVRASRIPGKVLFAGVSKLAHIKAVDDAAQKDKPSDAADTNGGEKAAAPEKKPRRREGSKKARA